MPTNCLRAVFACLIVFLFSISARAEKNWPGWRGPRGDGTSLEKGIPVHWDGPLGKNIAWKVAVPGDGYASPTIWGDSVFMVSCLKESQERILLRLDRRTGKTLWQRTVAKSPLESKHPQNSYASSTPVTDGKTVFVSFLQVDGKTIPAPNVGRQRPITPGEMVVAAYDFDGNRKWTVKPGEFISAHGYCSCPVLYDNLVIVNGDHDGKSYILALEQATGKTIWKVSRNYGIRSYVTPIIRRINGRTEMVFSGSKHIISLNPLNGTKHWSIEGPAEQFVASMVYDGNLFYMAAGFPTYHVMAIRPEGKGDVTDTHVVWHSKEARCYVPSPVLVGNYLLVADDQGSAHCFDKTNGKHLWRTRMGRHYHSSLVTAGGLAYFLDDDGVMKVVEPGEKLKVVAKNKLGEFTSASPAISNGQLFIRGVKHLFCIGQAGSKVSRG